MVDRLREFWRREGLILPVGSVAAVTAVMVNAWLFWYYDRAYRVWVDGMLIPLLLIGMMIGARGVPKNSYWFWMLVMSALPPILIFSTSRLPSPSLLVYAYFAVTLALGVVYGYCDRR